MMMSALTYAGSAQADGVAGGAAPVESDRCAAGPFSGFYIGAALGYANHDSDVHDKLNGGSFGDDDSAFTGGLLSGYNYQCGRFLIGYEGDINFFSSESESDVDTITLKSSIDWYGTQRLRLGLVSDDTWLFYVTGGLAYGDVEHRFSDSAFAFSKKDSDTQFGWTIGGGVEFLHYQNWTFRAEGLYIDLGDETETYEVSTTGPYGCTTNCTAKAEWEDDFWVARLGVTYKFGAREEPVPLK
jgi:outer membrane immunogenic protein